MSDFAILFDPAAYSFSEKMMGRQSAGLAFMQAIADHGFSKLYCYAASRSYAERCAQVLSTLGSTRTGVSWIHFGEAERLSEPGLLFRPDPGIGQHAWHRLSRAQSRSYSICGITHTISSHAPMSAFADYLTAPIESWDAVICTSRAARDAVRYVVESQAEHLAARIGASRFSLPQLPVIPLGVHSRRFSRTADMRQSARQRLGVADDEVAVLFAGRLVVHSKAHPLAMYLALEQAAKGRKVVLIQAGHAPRAEILRIFIDEPKRFCPSIRIVMVDGANVDLYSAAWSAADIFTSLSDNIQETFGLTPIEAMAAGLPVVVTDWDGYKDTVRDGVDGFRVPTLTLPPGQGAKLADSYDLGLADFDLYSAYTSQLVAVNIEAAAQAYRRLIEDPDLRARMGAAGAQRAREAFDWKIIFRRYLTLWEDLSERRRSDPQLTPMLPRRQRPDRADPFSMFAGYPTHCIQPGTFFRRRAGMDMAEAVSRRELASTSFAKPILPDPALIEGLLNTLAADWTSFDDLTRAITSAKPDAIASALVWLSKVGVTDFRK